MSEPAWMPHERAEQNLGERRSLHALARDDYDGGEPMPPRLVYVAPGLDPWFCWCGEAIDADEPECPHGLFYCADHIDRCTDCADEKADAREDFQRKYDKENGR